MIYFYLTYIVFSILAAIYLKKIIYPTFLDDHQLFQIKNIP